MASTIQEAQNDLKDLEENLQTIQELLNVDPNNEEYLQMQRDATEGIQITKQIIVNLTSKNASTSGGNANEQLNIVNDDTVEQKNHDNNSDKVNTIINKTKPLDDDKNNNNNNNKGYVNKQTDKKSRWGDTTAVECIPIVKTKSMYKPGEIVEVKLERNEANLSPWYPGIVQAYIEQNMSYNIFVLDDKTMKNSIEETCIRKLRPINVDIKKLTLLPGTIVKAYYKRDGMYYDAQVTGVPDLTSSFNILCNNETGGLYNVKYVDYGNMETLPIEYLIPKKEVEIPSTSFSTISSDRPMDESVLTQVPSYLIIKDTDSEAEKERKRKKIKSIKSKNRFLKKDIQSNKRQASWQSFQSKMSNKKSRFGGSSRKKKW